MTAALSLPPLLLLFLGLAAGFALGQFHFRSLRRICACYVEGQAVRALLLQLARLVLAGLVLFGLARLGAGPLLAGGAGFFLGRVVIMRGERKVER